MTSPLRIVQPQTVSDSVLVATDIPESAYPAWSNVTTYSAGQRVHLASTHRDYQSLLAGNTGNDPATNTTAWADIGPTNRWAVFDGSNSTQTEQSTAGYYRLAPVASFDTLALLNTTGLNAARARVTHPTYGSLFDRTIDVASLPAESGWWEWFYGERSAPTVALFEDIPGLLGSELRIDLTGTTGMAVGVIAWGQARSMGMGVRAGARVGIQDYSRKETNAYGDTVLVQRAFAKRATFDITIESSKVDESIDFLAAVRAVPCLWIGSAQYAATVVYGFFKEFDMNIAYTRVSECSISLEGLT